MNNSFRWRGWFCGGGDNKNGSFSVFCRGVRSIFRFGSKSLVEINMGGIYFSEKPTFACTGLPTSHCHKPF
jgi:hypothetical protein